MGKGTNTVTQQSAPPPQVMQNYQEVMKRAQGDAGRPLQQYGGGLLAGFNPTQQGAFQQTAQAAGAQQPYLQQATTYANMGATPVFGNVDKFSGANVAKYQSPYTQQVIDSTMANLNKNYGIQSNDLLGQGISQGNAFGGDRMGVAQAELGRNQGLATGQTIAGLENQGYTQALGELNTQQNLQEQGLSADAWRRANAATQMGGLGAEAQQTGLAGASANMQVGGMQQQLQQEKLNIPYEMYQQQQAYPFQTTQFLGGLAGLGQGMGGSSSTTSPSPSLISQLGGLGLTGLGIAGETGGFGANGWLTGLLGGGAAAGGLGGALGTAAGVTAGGGVADLLGSGLGLGLALERGGRAGYDDGGAVALPATAAAAPGADPMAQTQYQKLMAMSMEQLQHAAVAYPPSTAQGQLVARALEAKRMTPASNAPQPPMPQTGLAGGLSGGLQPQSMARGGFAGGGLAGQTLPGYGINPSVEDVLGPPETGFMPMPDISGSQEGGSEDYQTGPAYGPYDNLSGSTPQAYGRGPGKYHLPQVAIDKSATHPPGGLLSAGLDRSVTRHGGGLDIPPPPDPASQADSSSPADTSGSVTDAASSDAGSPDVAGGGGQQQAAPASAPAPAAADPAATDEAPKDSVGDFLNSPWMPVVQAGLATMAGTSPFAAVNIGRGGLEGVQAAQGQRKQQAELELTRAQAEGSKAQADLNRMIVDAYKHMPGGPGGAVVSGAGGGGGGGGGDEPITMNDLAPHANALMEASLMAGGLPNGVGRARAETLRAMAEMDPDLQHAEAMLKLGATAHRDSQAPGGFTWSMPADALNITTQNELAKPQDAEHPKAIFINGQPFQFISKNVGADGKTVVTLNSMPQPGGSGGGDGGSSDFNMGNIRNLDGPGFRTYKTLKDGIEGVINNLDAYGKKGINTVHSIISTWAPPNENDTAGYIKDVSAWTGFAPNAKLNMQDPRVQAALTMAIVRKEKGQPPQQGQGAQQGSSISNVTEDPGATKGAEAFAGDYAEQYKEARNNAQGAQKVLGRLDLMDNDVQALNTSGWSSTGAGADSRIGFAKSVNAVLGTFGIDPLFNPSKIGTWEDLKKEANNAGFELARTLGSREAQMIVAQATSSVPNPEITGSGARLVSASLRQVAQRQIDWYNYATEWMQNGHPNNLLGADIAFNKQYPPSLYATRAMAAAVPQPYIDILKKQPDTAASFDKHFGPGTAEVILGQ